MPTVTLLVKAYRSFLVQHFDSMLKTMLEGLKVKTQILGVTERGWIQASVSGEDENAALHYLSDRIGLCVEKIENLSKFSNCRGFVVAPAKNKNDLHVDVGVFHPENVDAVIPLQHLQAQLVDGRNVPMEKLIRLFGFCDNFPLILKTLNIEMEKPHIEAELTEKQLALLRRWTNSLFDRLLVIGASSEEISHALKRTGFSRDIVSVETLGAFEHAVVCKLGTDGVGLIPRMGRALRKASLSVFSPTKILSFLGTKAEGTSTSC